MAISVSEVTDVDRRVGRRLGMDAEKVNMVLNTWAEEYLKLEMESSKMAVTPPVKKTPVKRTKPKVAAAKETGEVNGSSSN
jgi:hypothetical protein